MSSGLFFAFAFTAGTSAVSAKSNEEGCCFSIGYGDFMRPCCLGTVPNVTLSSCFVGSRPGGATGFSQDGCPNTAEEAHQAILEEDEQGCCFSIGFGDQMQPCCLETKPHVGLSSCSIGSRIGGATGFRRGSCPDSAEEAHQAIQPVLEEASGVSHEHPQGCCFSIGFGDLMRPCCLLTSPSVEFSVCNVESRIGGATGFQEGSCPVTAEEAHQAILREDEQGCCFSIGFGDHMQPCCLETTPNVPFSSCSVGSRTGGVTGFRREKCPDSAEDAHSAIQLADESSSGCCFSIGFGALMRPCCLQTLPSAQLAFCHVGNRMGGATGFTEGVCPTTAEEAHETLQHLQQSTNNPTTTLLNGKRWHAKISALPYVLIACVSFAAGSIISVAVMISRRQNRDDPSEFMPLDA